MKTHVLPVTSFQAIPRAKALLESGEMVAFPTDTVYGLGACAFNARAVERLFTAKERPVEKAIPILIAGVENLPQISADIPAMALTLAAAFWPGALTLVIPKHPALPAVISSGATVGVRVPGLAFTRELLQAVGPLAVTSANRSDQPNPLDAEHVLQQLGGRLPLILDGGPTAGGIPSTVVDCTGPEPKILRPGPIPLEEILSACRRT